MQANPAIAASGISFAVFYFVAIGLAVLFGWMKGKKYSWQYTLTRLIINVAAVLIAIPLTRVIARLIAKNVFNMAAIDLFSPDSPLLKISSTIEILIALIAMLLGLGLFLFIRLIIKNIFKIFSYFFAKTLTEITTKKSLPTPQKGKSKKEIFHAEKPQLASIAIGIVGCVLGVIFVFAPYTGMLGLADDAISAIDTDLLEDADVDADVIHSLQSITASAPVKVNNALGGKLIFNSLTKYKISTGKIKLNREINFVASLASGTAVLTSEGANNESKVDAIDDILDKFDKTVIIPTILSDIINVASTTIEEGGDFFGNKVSDANSATSMKDMLLTELVHFYKGCTPDSIKSDVRTAGKVIAVIIEHDATENLEDPEKLLADTELTNALLTELLSNDHLISLTSTVVEMGILALEEGLGATEENMVTVTHKDSVENPEKEAKLLSDALAIIVDLSDSIGGDDIAASISSLLTPAGKLLDILAATEMVGKTTTDELILLIFTSDKASSVLPMDKDNITTFVNSLIDITNREGGSYTDVMMGISDMVDVLANASANDMTSIENVQEALNAITPESAEALKHVVTPEFVGELGLDEKNAEGVSDLLVNVFDEISNAKKSTDEGGLGLNEEEYAEETEKISKILETTLVITDPENTDTVEVENIASDIMDSKILTNTIINSVYDEEGNVKVDPMGTERALSEDEKTELLNTLNTKLDEANAEDYSSEEEKEAAIEAKEKLAIAVGAYMNADLEIVDGKVVFKNN